LAVIPAGISAAEAGHRPFDTLAEIAPVQLDPATEEVGAVFH
jgi:hypothetical protein